MSTSVRYFHWQMPGAPELTRTQGSLIAILDACLVNGFNLRPVTTLVVDAGVATVTTATAHGYEVDTVVRISGASPAGLNGDYRVLSATSTTFTFAAAQPNGTASGSIEARLAPAGWEKPFSDTNIGVYRSPNPESTRFFLRVKDDEENPAWARVVGYEQMTDVNTGTAPFPTNLQVSGGAHWIKTDTGTANVPRAWVVVADDRTMYVYMHGTATTSARGVAGVVWGFGDFDPLSSTDEFACFISGSPVSNHWNPLHHDGVSSLGAAVNGPGLWVARPHTGFAGSVQAAMFPSGVVLNPDNAASGVFGFAGFPNAADNGLYLYPAVVATGPFATRDITMRGVLRGLRWVGHVTAPSDPTFATGNKIQGLGDLSGRSFMALKDANPTLSNPTPHVVVVEINSDWG